MKAHKVTSQGKAVISDNPTEDIIIETLVSQFKVETHSDEVSDPQRRGKVPFKDEELRLISYIIQMLIH